MSQRVAADTLANSHGSRCGCARVLQRMGLNGVPMHTLPTSRKASPLAPGRDAS